MEWQRLAKCSKNPLTQALLALCPPSFSCNVSARKYMVAVTFSLLIPQIYFKDLFKALWFTTQAPSHDPTTLKVMYLKIISIQQ